MPFQYMNKIVPSNIFLQDCKTEINLLSDEHLEQWNVIENDLFNKDSVFFYENKIYLAVQHSTDLTSMLIHDTIFY